MRVVWYLLGAQCDRFHSRFLAQRTRTQSGARAVPGMNGHTAAEIRQLPVSVGGCPPPLRKLPVSLVIGGPVTLNWSS